MEDREIVSLFLARNEGAVAEISKKFGGYCFAIAYRILGNREDAEEITNDCYLKVWNSIPPNNPELLAPYLGTICRRAALNRAQKEHALKRGGSQLPSAAEELSSILSDAAQESVVDTVALRDALNRFLSALPIRSRRIFLRRYWYFYPPEEIADQFGISVNSVNVTLHRTRLKLRYFLEKEGFSL